MEQEAIQLKKLPIVTVQNECLIVGSKSILRKETINITIESNLNELLEEIDSFSFYISSPDFVESSNARGSKTNNNNHGSKQYHCLDCVRPNNGLKTALKRTSCR